MERIKCMVLGCTKCKQGQARYDEAVKRLESVKSQAAKIEWCKCEVCGDPNQGACMYGNWVPKPIGSTAGTWVPVTAVDKIAADWAAEHKGESMEDYVRGWNARANHEAAKRKESEAKILGPSPKEVVDYKGMWPRDKVTGPLPIRKDEQVLFHGKTIGGRVPFEEGETVWSRLTRGGPWIVVKDDGGDRVDVIGVFRDGSKDRWAHAVELCRHRPPAPTSWVLRLALLTTLAAMAVLAWRVAGFGWGL